MVKGLALGMIETLGLSALIAAADAAAKTADVRIYSYEKADAGILAVYIYGDISSVNEAIHVGKEAAKSMGKLLHYSVIPSPAFDFAQLIRKKLKPSEPMGTQKKIKQRASSPSTTRKE
jgi:ethanolamine utilization protein EutM